MSKGNVFCSRPFKFVIVGESCSGKSTLIQRFMSGFREEKDYDDASKPTFVCDVHSVLLNSTVKHVCENGASVALSNDDIAKLLWVKKFSKSASFPRNVALMPEDYQDIIWDEIFVYLNKPRHKKDSNSSTGSTKESNSGLAAAQSSPAKHVKDLLQARASESLRTSCEAKTSMAEIELDLWDTAGDKSLMWYRWYACTGADAVLLCVPLSSILSFESSRLEGNDETNDGTKIAEVLQKFMSDEFLYNRTKKVDYRVPPVLLVGTKSDECDIGSGIDSEEEDIVDAVGLNLAAEIGCCDFVSCSGSKGYGVTSVIETALAIALTSDGKYRASNMKSNRESEASDAETSLAREVAQPTYFRVHSFAKASRPEVKIADKNIDSESRQKGSAIDRLPPQLYFPPPPDFSPPSTLPYSSSSSLERSRSLSSLDSCADHVPSDKWMMNAPTTTNDKSVPKFNVLSPGKENGPVGEITPTPRPRRLNSDTRSVRPEGIYSFEDLKIPDNTSVPVTPPVPKPRNVSNSPILKRKQKREKRRETIFVKFLQT